MRRALLLLSAVAAAVTSARSVHWTIRSSSLEHTLNFTIGALGMRVLRHKEYSAASPSERPWSTTMVGFDQEELSFTIELAYTYGVHTYTPGEAFQRFVLWHDDPSRAVAAAQSQGYTTSELAGGHLIRGDLKD